jgi:hypothetical protein
MTDDLETTVPNGVAAVVQEVIPRMGDEIVLPDGKRLIVLSVQRAKGVLMDAGSRASEVEASMRAAMGDRWRETYWKAYVRHGTGGNPFWLDVMDVRRHEGIIESHHREIT